MGWYSTVGATKRDIIQECTQGHSSDKGTSKVLAKRCIGNELWVVREDTLTGQEPTQVICLYLLSKGGGEWGYKPLDEAIGPFYYKCPLCYLKLAPVVNPGWRAAVKEYHDLQAAYRALFVGVVVRLQDFIATNGNQIEHVTISHKQRGKWIGHRDGTYYRIEPRHLPLDIAMI